MSSDNPFIQGVANLMFLVKASSSREYDKYLFNQININHKFVLCILHILKPLIYIANIFLTIIIIIYKLIFSIINYRWVIKEDEYKSFDTLYLFFINHFLDRCKAAGVYEKSKYWIVGPAIDITKYNLSGKTIVNYKHYLMKVDAFRIFYSACTFLLEYIIKVRTLNLIYKIWDFYEVYYSLRRIGKDSIYYFSNQSDKYALLFDQLPSKDKVLIQHGIVANWGCLPYRLENISKFYAMSNLTWQDAYKNLFSNTPYLILMNSTLFLYDIPNSSYTVLIVAEIDYINIERNILEELSKDQTITIYLKKHPALMNDGCYRELQNKYKFNYITEKKFPKVDFVISYYSTLAYEYMAHGIPVYMYMSKQDFSIVRMMSQLSENRMSI